MKEPSFRMDPDGVHFWLAHECNFEGFKGSNWHDTMLPIGGNGWHVVTTDPLTVTPSILCGSCHLHGFITNGKWVGV